MDELQQYIAERQISGVLAEQLLALSGESAARVGVLCRELQPSANTLRGFLSLAEQIAARDKSTVAAVFAEFDDVVCAEKVQSKEKQRRVRLLLEAKRYPARAALQNELVQLQKEMVRESGLRIEYPRDLEGDTLSISFRVSSVDDLTATSARVEKLATLPATKRMFALLRGEES